MEKEYIYMRLPYDLSGSRTKNRFRNEILWGLKKIFQIYELNNDFYVVFDYVCDIEVHTEDIFEFYQVKTHNRGNNYNINEIIKKDKSGRSVLGKLYNLKYQCAQNKGLSKIALVSNVPLKCKSKTYTTIEEKCLDTLEEEIKGDINNKIKEELQIEKIEYDNTYYIYTNMNLIEPQNDIIGNIVNLLEEVLKVKPIRINSLYRLLVNRVSEKASYEYECRDYQMLLDKKAISKREFEEMISKHIEISNEALIRANDYIVNEYRDNFKMQTEMKKALSFIITSLGTNEELQSIERKIVKYIEDIPDEMDTELKKLQELLYEQFKSEFSIIYTIYDKNALIILILHKYMEDMYEKNDNK